MRNLEAAPRNELATTNVADADYDVIIAGGGLVGLSLAPALTAARLSVALVDRAPMTMPKPPTGDDDWDPRVYAISPGSVAFLRALGAWQSLPPERIQPVETMRVEGDAGALLQFSAYELGERALAWIVEERALPRDCIDHAFVGWPGEASVHGPRRRLRLDLAADAGNFVLFTPQDANFFCFEPVDHAIDAVHLPGGAAAHGMTVLAPGEGMQRRYRFTVHADG